MIYRGLSPAPLQVVGSRVGCPIYKGIFPNICYLFPGPNFLTVIIQSLVAWSLQPVLYSCNLSPLCGDDDDMLMIVVILLVILLKIYLDLRKFQSHTKTVARISLYYRRRTNLNRTPMIVQETTVMIARQLAAPTIA